MCFAGVNGFNTVFIFNVEHPQYLPFQEYKDLLPYNKICVSSQGHCKVLTLCLQGDTTLHITGPISAGPKTTTLNGFTAETKEKAVEKFKTLLIE